MLRAEEYRVSEGEDAAIRGGHPLAVARRDGGCADDGLVEPRAPIEPKKRASPKANTRQSTPPTTGATRSWRSWVVLLMEFGEFAMMRRMLRGIKVRGESLTREPGQQAA